MKLFSSLLISLFLIICIISLYSISTDNFTGMVINSGTTNVTVQETASITFQSGYNETYFGQGTPNTGSSLTIATNQENSNGFYNGSYCNGTAVPSTTGTPVKPLCIRNDGNDDTTCVKINAGAAPTDWLTCTGSCAQTPNARTKAYDNSTSACTSGLRNTWGQLNTTQRVLCTELGTDETLGVDLELTIPQNPTTGSELSTTITIEGSDNC